MRTRVAWWMAVAVVAVAVSGCMQVEQEGSGDAEPVTYAILIDVVDEPPNGTAFTLEGAVEATSEEFTAFQQLEAFTEAEGVVLNTTYYESFESTSVDAINGVEGQQDPEGPGFYYWKFLLNGEASDVGADQAVLSPGDEVEWRFVLEE